MANKLATFQVLLKYTGPGGDVVAPSPVQVIVPYQSDVVGTIDVPDATAASVVYTVPFGPIVTECRGALIVNRTANGSNPGTDLGVKINGAAAISHQIQPGGGLLIMGPVAAGANKLLSLTLTTRIIQVGDGQIDFYLFGDPLPA